MKKRKKKRKSQPNAPRAIRQNFPVIPPRTLRNMREFPEIIDPSDKAKLTVGNSDTGRITLRQYDFLVGRGYDGDVVRHWTHYRASKEIGRLGLDTQFIEATKLRPQKSRAKSKPSKRKHNVKAARRAKVTMPKPINSSPLPSKTVLPQPLPRQPIGAFDPDEGIETFVKLAWNCWSHLSSLQRRTFMNSLRDVANGKMPPTMPGKAFE